MTKFITRLLRDETGATAIEYALIATLIAVASAGVILTAGQSVSSTFNNIANAL